MKIILFPMLFCALVINGYADSLSYVSGRAVIKIADSIEGIFEPQVELLKNGEMSCVKGDPEGYFRMGPIEQGEYNLRIQAAELSEPFEIKALRIPAGKNISLGNVFVNGFIIPWGHPLPTRKHSTITKELLKRIPVQTVIVTQLSSSPIHHTIYSRTPSSIFYIDGLQISNCFISPKFYETVIRGVPAESEYAIPAFSVPAKRVRVYWRLFCNKLPNLVRINRIRY